jgi:prepilin-type N-terminal cleavage/methylation domain-containing protein
MLFGASNQGLFAERPAPRCDRGGRAGFTIIELMVAVMVGLMMLGLAVPSVRGVLEEQRLREKLASFEEMVRRSAALASKSKKEVRLIWFKDGLRALTDWDQLQQAGPAGAEGPRWEQSSGGEEPVFFAVGEDESLSLSRLAARNANPLSEWSFWPSGIREPVEIYYEGPLGKWGLRFSALVPDPEIVYFQLN